MGGGQKINAFSLNSENYRYGFNAKEKDENGEFGNLTHYDYGFRIYNPSIAKFLSVDPLSPDYPELTPYQFASNRPIQGIDLDGLEFSDAKWGYFFWSLEQSEYEVYGEKLSYWQHHASDSEKFDLFITFSVDLALTYGLANAEVEFLQNSPTAAIKRAKKKAVSPKINNNVGNPKKLETISRLTQFLKVNAEARVIRESVPDPGRGRLSPLRENTAMIHFNNTLGEKFGKLRRLNSQDAITKAGDFIFDSGRMKGKSMDHVGPQIGKPYDINKVIKSVDAHYLKTGVDFIYIDMRALSTADKGVLQNHLDECVDACDIERTIIIGQ